MSKINEEMLIDFLVEAKRNTYAAQGDDASVPPALTGSKQLEYRRGKYFYRDIYFGSAFFVGQETVELEQCPIWSMVYSGGVRNPDATGEVVASIYRFLREALTKVDASSVFRGPTYFENNNYIFINENNGDIDNFHGKEMILLEGANVYELRYSGGTVR